MTAVEDKIRLSFGKQNMMQTLGAEIESVSDGEVVITAPILPGSRQQHGVAHAALSFAIGDTAAGYAALTKMPEDSEVMTAEMKINLLAPGDGDLLRATGKVIKPGRRLVIVTAEVHAVKNGQEKLTAILQGTMVPVKA
ncbi:PaaI family thioesterase [Leisingera sp. ANG-Vp]|uniref:PaaI family thioesterase n=1 Tax=Leisingera sp. ANG-Vp TaxID=1577896 RepID=UPI00057E2034|nr:PaaI family thioesterase [Leisingera sp. ANG-Vp]KIC17834.1 phenylacetic acid degradation protein [Leisingera sp. ANG-Vp]